MYIYSYTVILYNLYSVSVAVRLREIFIVACCHQSAAAPRLITLLQGL